MARVTASAQDVVASLRQVSLALERWRGDFSHRWGLAGNDSVVMSHLVAAGGGVRPRDLAALLNVTTGSMTAMLDRLERVGFVQRMPNPDDRRSVHVVLTDRGAEALADGQTQLTHRIGEAFDDKTRLGLVGQLESLAELISGTAADTVTPPAAAG